MLSHEQPKGVSSTPQSESAVAEGLEQKGVTDGIPEGNGVLGDAEGTSVSRAQKASPIVL